MSYELRPLTLAEILDAAFRLVQTQWRTLIGLSMLMQIPLVLLGSWADWLFDPFAQPIDPGDELTREVLLEIGGVIAGMGLTYFILYPFIAAAVTASVANFYLGRRFELGDAARAGWQSLFRLMASYVVYLVVYLVAILIVAGAVTMVVVMGSTLLAGVIQAMGSFAVVLGVLLGIVAFAFALFVFFFAAAVAALLPPVAVLESGGVVETVSRAFALASTARTRVTLVILAAGMIVGFPVFGAQMMIGFVPFLGLLIWAAFQAVGFAFTTSVAVVLYFDLRCRAENYDLELLAEQVEAGPGLGHG